MFRNCMHVISIKGLDLIMVSVPRSFEKIENASIQLDVHRFAQMRQFGPLCERLRYLSQLLTRLLGQES